jgi:hypothetical protein
LGDRNVDAIDEQGKGILGSLEVISVLGLGVSDVCVDQVGRNNHDDESCLFFLL